MTVVAQKFTVSTPDAIWLSSYPEGMPSQLDMQGFSSLAAMLEVSFAQYPQRSALSFLGSDFSYQDLDQQSAALAVYFQSLGLERGERVAVMLPNSPQYVVCMAAVLRAGLVLVNVNPLYAPRELGDLLQDSQVSVIVVMENVAHTLQACLAQMPTLQVRHVITTALGDCLRWPKSAWVNLMVRHVKKRVPSWHLPHAVSMHEVIRHHLGQRPVRPVIKSDEVALLQYTGGTTGSAKGAMLTHRNLMANIFQAKMWCAPVVQPVLVRQQVTHVCALPLCSIFSFTISLLGWVSGSKVVLIPNPRDLHTLFKELNRNPPHVFPGVNILYSALLNHPKFQYTDWSQLKICPSGGAAIQPHVAKLWLECTDCPICEGYGLTETAPLVCANPITARMYRSGVGIPLPGTMIKIIDDAGQEVPLGESGELVIAGPQVMAGYWRRPEETRKAMTADGYFKSGDIGVQDEDGFIRIVDRKKDMIRVNCFNVYPNEIETVVGHLPGVLECAAIGVPDQDTGEAVKLFIVRKDPLLDESLVRQHCQVQLTDYKQPKYIVFSEQLPKSPVGKILRKNLREPSAWAHR